MNTIVGPGASGDDLNLSRATFLHQSVVQQPGVDNVGNLVGVLVEHHEVAVTSHVVVRHDLHHVELDTSSTEGIDVVVIDHLVGCPGSHILHKVSPDGKVLDSSNRGRVESAHWGSTSWLNSDDGSDLVGSLGGDVVDELYKISM